MITTSQMALKVWNLLTDLFDHDQLADNWAAIDAHDHTPAKGVQVPTGGIADGAVTTSKLATGAIDETTLDAALAQTLGVNQAGQTAKGACSIAASESRTNVAYGTMPTPDQVTGIVLPTNGLLQVAYQATWQESVAGAASAAIFLGANQVQMQTPTPTTSTLTQSATIGGEVAGGNQVLASCAGGLISTWNDDTLATSADVTTGQILGLAAQGGGVAGTYGDVKDKITSFSTPGVIPVGGPCYIFAAAGTYTVSVQFKASSGSVTASNRKLWVKALSFA